MTSKDVTSSIGSIRLLLPLILIFLIGAGSAFGCPEHTTKAAYRTKATKTRTVSLYAPTVITYRDPRCVNNVYQTRGARYVSVRARGYHPANGARYVAVRNGDSVYKARRARYIAVRNIDLDDAPRYVAVRRHPTFVDDRGTRYVAVRDRVPKARYIAVRDLDIDDDEPRYVAVRTRAPHTRYVAVRDIDIDHDSPRYAAVRTVSPRARYVAVRNVVTGCSRVVALRSCLDPIETANARHVVVKSDYLAGTEEVIVPNSSYDDTAYLAPPIDDIGATEYARYTPVAYRTRDTLTEVSDIDQETTSSRMVAYAPVYSNDYEDQAILDKGGTTYVVAGDIGDACLSPIVVHSSPAIMRTRAVSYSPVEYVDDDAFDRESDITYVAVDDNSPPIRYASVEDDALADMSTTYIATDDDAVEAGTVSYIPVDDVEELNAETVSYVPAESVSYIAVDERDAGTVMYVPASSIREADVMDISADECVTLVATSKAEPAHFADDSMLLVSDQQIAANGPEVAFAETSVNGDIVRDHYVDADSGEVEYVVGSA